MLFYLDETLLNVDVPSSVNFLAGNNQCLSALYQDPTTQCDWYDAGYKIKSFESVIAHQDLLAAVENVVIDKLRSLFPSKILDNFSLSKYHQFVSEEEHRVCADRVLKRLYVNDLPEIADIFQSL